MDAISDSQQDSQYHLKKVCIAVLFVFANLRATASAQTVTPEQLNFFLRHSLSKDAQEFPAALWDISNRRFSRGCVVQWTIEPFVNEVNAGRKADADVRVRLIRSGNSSRWRTTQEFDSTNFVAGKNSATVGVASARRGNSVAELYVRFRTPRLSQLATGKYHTTLTGTISGL